MTGHAVSTIRAAVYCGVVFLSLWAALLHLSSRLTFHAPAQRILWEVVVGLTPAVLVALGLRLVVPRLSGRGIVVIAAGFTVGSGVFLVGLSYGSVWPSSLLAAVTEMQRLGEMYFPLWGAVRLAPYGLAGTMSGGALAGASTALALRLCRGGLGWRRVAGLLVAWPIIDGAAYAVWMLTCLGSSSSPGSLAILGGLCCLVGAAGGAATALLAWPVEATQPPAD